MPDQEDEWAEEQDGNEEEELTDEQKAEQERIEARAAEIAEEKFRERQKGYNRRYNTASSEAKSRGLGFDEEGHLVLSDTKQFQKWLSESGLLPQAPTATATTQQPNPRAEIDARIDALGDPPDATYEPQKHRDYVRKVAQIEAEYLTSTRIESAIEKAVAPLVQQLQQAQGMASRPVVAGIPAIASAALKELGLENLTEVEGFGQFVAKSITEGLPAEQWGDPEAIAAATYYLIPALKKAAADNPSPKTTQRNAQGADQRRAQHAGAEPLRSNGRGKADNATPEEAETLAEYERTWGRKISLDKLRKLRNPDAHNPYRGKSHAAAQAER